MKIFQSSISCLKKYGKRKFIFFSLRVKRLKLNEVHEKIPLSWSTENLFQFGFQKLFKYFYIFQADWAYQIWHWQRLKNNNKKKCEGKDVDFFYDINYMALATCRWLCNNNSNGGDGGGSKVWKMPAMGFKDSIIWPARPSSSYVLSTSWCVKYSFFFLSFRFAGKFNSCGNSVNLKGAAAFTHGNTRTRAKTRTTPLATRPVCQQGSLYPFDRAA